MIFYGFKPSALSDGSARSEMLDALSEMRRHRTHLIEQVEKEIEHAKASLDSVATRAGWSKKNPSQSQAWNSMGEFQQCISHRADLYLVQFNQLDEIIRHFESILTPKAATKKEKDSSEQRTEGSRLRQPERSVGKRAAAKRPRKSDGG